MQDRSVEFKTILGNGLRKPTCILGRLGIMSICLKKLDSKMFLQRSYSLAWRPYGKEGPRQG